jgi:hypothetical protein
VAIWSLDEEQEKENNRHTQRLTAIAEKIRFVRPIRSNS